MNYPVIKAEWRKRQRYAAIALVMGLIGSGLLAMVDLGWVKFLGVGIIIPCLIVIFRFNRCPYCEGYIRFGDSNFCRHCGVELR